jgi:uncharacterized protein (TIGR03435 family)
MKKLMLWFIALAAVPAALFGQNVVGTWQGTLAPPGPRPPLRIVIKITRADNESLKAALYSIDQPSPPINASSISQNGTVLKIGIVALGGDYEGKLSSDGNTITGTFTQGGPLPLVLTKATPATAWAIPEPPPPPKPMAANAKLAFEVATIKPSNPANPGQSILVGRGGSNMFTTTNTTLNDLIIFAYGVHQRQVVGAPAWVETEKYDLSAKPEQEGVPNPTQLRTMVQKLLEERFELKFHKDKKELAAFTLTVGKGGPKLNKNETGGNLPGFGGRGPGNIGVRNSTMEEFAGFLQARLVDRPVVDQTGLTDRYDFTIKWIPDQAQLAQVPPGVTLPPPPEDAAPDLFSAVSTQLGLKLESTKTPVEVMMIDKVAKPSEN